MCSLAGEQTEDRELTVHNNAVIAAETRAELDRDHEWHAEANGGCEILGKDLRASPLEPCGSLRSPHLADWGR